MNEEEKVIRAHCAATEHRGTWLAFIYEEMLNAGVENAEEICKRAIRRCGHLFGERMKAKYDEDDDFAVKAKYIFPEDFGKAACKANVIVSGTEVHNIVGNCPLANAWKKLGYNKEFCGKLCDITMECDRGIAEINGLDIDWDDTIATGAEVCDLHYTLKKL